jgi:hypothetical protein
MRQIWLRLQVRGQQQPQLSLRPPMATDPVSSESLKAQNQFESGMCRIKKKKKKNCLTTKTIHGFYKFTTKVD